MFFIAGLATIEEEISKVFGGIAMPLCIINYCLLIANKKNGGSSCSTCLFAWAMCHFWIPIGLGIAGIAGAGDDVGIVAFSTGFIWNFIVLGHMCTW